MHTNPIQQNQEESLLTETDRMYRTKWSNWFCMRQALIYSTQAKSLAAYLIIKTSGSIMLDNAGFTYVTKDFKAVYRNIWGKLIESIIP